MDIQEDQHPLQAHSVHSSPRSSSPMSSTEQEHRDQTSEPPAAVLEPVVGIEQVENTDNANAVAEVSHAEREVEGEPQETRQGAVQEVHEEVDAVRQEDEEDRHSNSSQISIEGVLVKRPTQPKNENQEVIHSVQGVPILRKNSDVMCQPQPTVAIPSQISQPLPVITFKLPAQPSTPTRLSQSILSDQHVDLLAPSPATLAHQQSLFENIRKHEQMMKSDALKKKSELEVLKQTGEGSVGVVVVESGPANAADVAVGLPHTQNREVDTNNDNQGLRQSELNIDGRSIPKKEKTNNDTQPCRCSLM